MFATFVQHTGNAGNGFSCCLPKATSSVLPGGPGTECFVTVKAAILVSFPWEIKLNIRAYIITILLREITELHTVCK